MLMDTAADIGQLLSGDGTVRYCQLPKKVKRDASVTDPAARQGIAPDMQPPPNEGVGLRLDMPEVLPPCSQPGLEFRDPRELVFPRLDTDPGDIPAEFKASVINGRVRERATAVALGWPGMRAPHSSRVRPDGWGSRRHWCRKHGVAGSEASSQTDWHQRSVLQGGWTVLSHCRSAYGCERGKSNAKPVICVLVAISLGEGELA
jgi:hypothetical protein